jgi:hypothetical protein
VKLKDETGGVFGAWVVVCRAANVSANGNARWLCKCQACGTERVLQGIRLRRTPPPACVCIKKKLERKPRTAEQRARATELARQRRESNPELRSRQNAQARAWRAKHPEQARELARNSSANWAKNDPDAQRAQHAAVMRRRNARLASATREKYSRAELFELHDGLCGYCAAPATEFDHIDPIARGGADVAANIIPVCVSCNRSKADSTLLMWMRRRAA